MTLAERMKAARVFSRLSQTELAERAGVKQQVISKLERGLQRETADIVKLARACGVRAEWLDSGDGPMAYYSGANEQIQIAIRVMESLLPDLMDEGVRHLTTLARLSNYHAPESATAPKPHTVNESTKRTYSDSGITDPNEFDTFRARKDPDRRKRLVPVAVDRRADPDRRKK